MKTIIFVSFTLLFIFAGCNKNNPVETIPPSDDEILKSKIIGTWKAEEVYAIKFMPDNTFLDSIWFSYHFVVQGNYSINSGIINYSNCKLISGDTTILPANAAGYAYIYYPRRPQISGDTLSLSKIDIFSKSQGTLAPMNGKWTSSYIIVLDQNISLPTLTQGIITNEYNFIPDSSRYHLRVSILFNSFSQQIDSSGSYSYNPPNLSFVNYTTIKVESDQDKMYWSYPNADPIQYRKMQ